MVFLAANDIVFQDENSPLVADPTTNYKSFATTSAKLFIRCSH
jgi:hypothetical protein